MIVFQLEQPPLPLQCKRIMLQENDTSDRSSTSSSSVEDLFCDSRVEEKCEEVENTPPSVGHTSSELSPCVHYHYHRKYHHPIHYAEAYHSSYEMHSAKSAVLASVEVLTGDTLATTEDSLPLSPSITPPVMSPPSSATGSPLSTTEDDSDDCDSNQIENIEDIVLESFTASEPLSEPSSPIDSRQCDISHQSIRARSDPLSFRFHHRSHHRHRHHHHRYSPYSHPGSDSSVLRLLTNDSAQRSKGKDPEHSGNQDTGAVNDTTNTTATSGSESCDREDRQSGTVIPLASTEAEASRGNAAERIGVESSSTSRSSEPLRIDTRLANSQCAETRHSKTQLAQQILSVIRNDDFENFLSILNRSKPDLNVFINGQTALHYCLLLGE